MVWCRLVTNTCAWSSVGNNLTRINVQVPDDPDRSGQIVSGSLRVELIEKPQALLSKRIRKNEHIAYHIKIWDVSFHNAVPSSPPRHA
jgi:hypothetical protein